MRPDDGTKLSLPKHSMVIQHTNPYAQTPGGFTAFNPKSISSKDIKQSKAF
jgi:hypothetical protein